MQIRFYDNEKKNWDNDMKIHSDEVEFIEVDETTPYAQLTPKKTYKTEKAKKYDLNQQYIELFLNEDNTYASNLDSIIKSKPDVKILDKIIGKDYPNNGIDEYIDDLLKWTEIDTPNKVVLFDWDRTITVVEGLYTEQLNEKIINNEIKIHDIAVFIMGGEERLKKYKRMFDHFSKHKMAYFILTHNPNASKRSPLRQAYIDIIHEVANANTEKVIIDTEILLCSSDHCYKKHISACATVLKKYLDKCNQIAPSNVVKGDDVKFIDSEKQDLPKVQAKPKPTKKEPEVEEEMPVVEEEEPVKKRKHSMNAAIDDSVIQDEIPSTKRNTRKRKMVQGGKRRKTQRRKTRKSTKK